MIEHFGIEEKDLKKVIELSLKKGGEYADLYFEHTFESSFFLQDGIVNKACTNIDYGVGIRVISGNKQGYAFVENIDLKEMKEAARVASRIANGAKLIAPPVQINKRQFKNYYPINNLIETDSTTKIKISFLQKLYHRIFELDKRVIKVNVSLIDDLSYILYYNSEGLLCSDIRPMIQLASSCTMEKNGKIESAYSSRAARNNLVFITNEIVEEIAQEVVKLTSIMFKSVKLQGGEMPVVMGAGGSGILLHEAIGHAFEADFNRKNISIFSNKLGKVIGNKNIQIVDDGCIKFNRGSINFDDEGIVGQKTYIVNDGKLSSYLHDRISAKYYGVKSTGNGRRESFRHIPIPRMRCTYMENGNYSESEIIANVKKGVFVNNFTNGQVQIGIGDFTFFVKLGYLIEQGKLTRPIKDINIIGNGPKVLSDISMIGNNLTIDHGGWTCGKNGQKCPVSQGLPSILIKQLTVGGES